jgi:hypothetical protein
LRLKLARLFTEQEGRRRTTLLNDDLAAYAAECLTIRSKTGALVPLVFDVR